MRTGDGLKADPKNGVVLLSPHPTQAGCWCSCPAQRPNVSLNWCRSRARSCKGLRAGPGENRDQTGTYDFLSDATFEEALVRTHLALVEPTAMAIKTHR